jgi:hypothetical protein
MLYLYLRDYEPHFLFTSLMKKSKSVEMRRSVTRTVTGTYKTYCFRVRIRGLSRCTCNPIQEIIHRIKLLPRIHQESLSRSKNPGRFNREGFLIDGQNPPKNRQGPRTHPPGARDDPPPRRQESQPVLGARGEAAGEDGGVAQMLQIGHRGEMASHLSTQSLWKARLHPGSTRTARPGSMGSRQIGQSAAASSSLSVDSSTVTPPRRISSASASPFLPPFSSSFSSAVWGVGGGVRGARPRATASKR